MQKKIEISHDRIVEFRGVQELFKLSIEQINTDNLLKIEEYLQQNPETIYIVDEDNILKGIMTYGDVKKNLLVSQFEYNKNYSCISNIDDVNESFFEEFFNKHQNSIRSLPLVVKGVLQGEFVLHIGEDSILDKVQWKSFESGVVQYFTENSWKNVYVSDDEEASELKEIIKNIENIKLSSIEEADLIIEDKDISRKFLLASITLENHDILFDNEKESISLYSLYMKCMVRFIIENLNRHNVKLFLFESPRAEKIQGLTDEDKEFLKSSSTIEEMVVLYPEILESIYGESKSKHYISGNEFNEVYYIDKGQHYQLADFKGKYLNVIDGKRITIGAPEKYEAIVHVFGTCIARGHCVCDEETIESYLQKECNQSGRNAIKVVNYGLAGRVGHINDFHYVMNTSIKENDVVVFLAEYEDDIVEVFKECDVPVYETSVLFNRPHSYGRWFLDNMNHINHIANEVIAKYIYAKTDLGNIEICSNQRESFVLNENIKDEIGIDEQMIQEYVDGVCHVCEESGASLTNSVGSIVMNCNPFTNGHKYLIETSAAKVDTLIIFVVEENKSMFPFEDRIELVRKGTAHIPNVVVVPSGKFIISATTFPEYFNKNQLQEVIIDSSQDVTVFAKRIAPKLNISVRFVGEEPIDKVTCAYNRTMEEILPRYGIEFVEIPRKMNEDNVISASYVRKLMEENNREKIKAIVPITTYEYLERIWLK